MTIDQVSTFLAIGALILLACAVAAGCATAPPAPPEFRFALMGDLPYSQAQVNLLDGVIETSRGFKKRESSRPVIVALTTEGPEFSQRRWEDVVTPMVEVGAAFHVIVLGPPSNGIDEDSRNRGQVLDEGPRRTGGKMPGMA